MTRVVIADDQGIVRAGLALLVGRIPGCVVVAEAEDGEQAVRAATAAQAEVLLLDLAMPRLDGLSVIARLKRLCRGLRIIVLTGNRSGRVAIDAFAAGADGYVLKDGGYDDLVAAFRAVARGERYLSPAVTLPTDSDLPAAHLTGRERQVLKLLAEGHTNQRIAEILNISVKTAERHRENLIRKLAVNTPIALAAIAIREGLIE